MQIRFIIVPDLLQNAPMFKRVGPNAMRGRGIGAARGRATIQRGRCPALTMSVARLTQGSKRKEGNDPDEPRCSSIKPHIAPRSVAVWSRIGRCLDMQSPVNLAAVWLFAWSCWLSPAFTVYPGSLHAQSQAGLACQKADLHTCLLYCQGFDPTASASTVPNEVERGVGKTGHSRARPASTDLAPRLGSPNWQAGYVLRSGTRASIG